MASSVFYRFKSNKDTTRITFDGTGISVFELKKAIIETSNLGDGTDFELILLSSDEKEVYSDDTEIIPRSTTVIARRKPADRPGRGGAARYVSGKAPTQAKNAQRMERTSSKTDTGPSTSAASAISDSMTEKQREEAILQLGAEQWKQTQKEMANATRVQTTYHKPNSTPSNNNPPPEWYLCNRCGVKGHWIKDCPQNGNPDFDDARRIKKAIGIPRSRLVMIDKSTIMGDDGNVDINKLPPGAMVDGDGNYVTVKADKATWSKIQEKVNKSAAAQEEENRGSKDLQEKGLECSIDKRLFVEPVKTPCCHTTYCNECITNALLDDDLRCPNCGKDGVLIDNLEPDSDAIAKIKEYQEEKAAAKKDKEEAEANSADTPDRSKSASPEVKIEKAPSETALSTKGSPPASPAESGSKKRKADIDLDNNRASPMPAAVNEEAEAPVVKEPPKGPKAMMNQVPANNNNMMNNMNGFPMSMPMSMPGMTGMLPMMFDPMAMFNQMSAMNQMMGMGNMNGMGNMGGMNGMAGANSMGMNNVPTGPSGMANNNYQQQQNGMGRGTMNSNVPTGPRGQPYRHFNAAAPNAEDSPYFRPPVNPHRNNRRNINTRPADYREI